ncbi:hypothetical protein [Geothrix sp. 21YS21S-2]|uniref:hypothetical protein n=1 Tax=Geothrix sp. 21YS21S-2 TaxID=3068893 RepID=UPI0027BA2EE1|nr:hypothetical protein [Geothrix sp. 21YS21S-2]
MLLEPIKQACSNCHLVHVAIQQIQQVQAPPMPTPGFLSLNWGNLASLAGAIVAGVAAYQAKIAARASRESADVMKKEYKQQLNQQKPVMDFESIIFHSDTKNGQILGSKIYPRFITVKISNIKGENINYVDYVYAVTDDSKVLSIGYENMPLQYSHCYRHTLNIDLENDSNYNPENMFLFIFLSVMDSSNREAFSIYGQQVKPGNSFDALETEISKPIDTNYLILDSIREIIWDHVIVNMDTYDQLCLSQILNQDLDFREFRKQPQYKDFLPDIWEIVDKEPEEEKKSIWSKFRKRVKLKEDQIV